jgi:predicted PurR-regulated permease PerM
MVHSFIKYLLRNQVILALVLVLLAWFIWQTKDILAGIFIAYILMAALLPAVRYLRKIGFPKVIATIIPFFGIILFLLLIIFPLFPFFIDQVKSLLIGFPVYLRESGTILGITMNPIQIEEIISSEINSIGRNAVAVTTAVFGGVFSILTILIISFYLLLNHNGFTRAFAGLFHDGVHDHVLQTLHIVDEKLGAWVRGQIVLSVFIGGLTWISLTLLGLPYATPLAIMAGLLEILPTLGPTLAAIPAVIVALTISPTMAIIVAGLYIIIQLIENNLLVPKIMERAVGLNPVIVIIAITIGANIMGVVGALLSIPFISFLIVLYNSVTQTSRKSAPV